MTSLKIKILRSSAVPPRRMSEGAAGMDLHACLEAPVDLPPGGRETIPCGFAMELEPGYEAQVRPRSGLAARHGVTLANAPGTIDSDYRGEVKVILINLGQSAYTVVPGQRIAQMVVAPVVQVELVEADRLGATRRGAGGFGHTGQGA